MQKAADVAALVDWDGAARDATRIKAHGKGPWQKNGGVTDEWLGRSRGGITSKIHLCIDDNNGNREQLPVRITSSCINGYG
jgi:hypothetical protein